MEHILQFAINIDDERIKQIIEEKASKQIIEDIENDIRDSLFNEAFPSVYSCHNSKILSSQTEHIVMKFLKENKDEIIQLVSKQIYESVIRTKKLQEAKKALKEV